MVGLRSQSEEREKTLLDALKNPNSAWHDPESTEGTWQHGATFGAQYTVSELEVQRSQTWTDQFTGTVVLNIEYSLKAITKRSEMIEKKYRTEFIITPFKTERKKQKIYTMVVS